MRAPIGAIVTTASVLGASLVASVWGSEDAVEGAKAFAEKRPPQWQSR